MGKYVEVEPGINIYVEDVGQGRPVIFLHGWPLDSRMFEYQYMRLPAQGYRCIGIDARGFGKSDAPWEGYTYDRYADDVRAAIDALDLQDAVLVGFSMGGATAVRYAARHQGHGISKLLLLGAAAPSFTVREGVPDAMIAEDVNEQIIRPTMEDRPKMITSFGKKLTHKTPSVSSFAWVEMVAFQASGVGTLRAAEMLRDEDLRGDLAQITVPTAIFHGEKDKICPFGLAEAMNAGISGSHVVPFEKSGHAMMMDEPEKFNEELAAFLR
ncbi:alpha/beta fold hydrolase [Saccharibacillus alkalitolerans]|uniref:Alpha/beta hydrolase n=1 Tax=Saccharibacillus alkalitolerans TaxID=2705290 RepID=A0ABX0F5N8_9BACL|nr:alpha/beta hydrolase [Saccharibacillus alkalitolerans]NGZ76267.1 alpha/beta hydrolase [Saccharibacillus alkalitolerans]